MVELRELSGGREFVADLALDDFAERGVFRGKFFQRLDQGAIAALQLFHPPRDYVDEHVRVLHDFECCSYIFVSHVGKERAAPSTEADCFWVRISAAEFTS